MESTEEEEPTSTKFCCIGKFLDDDCADESTRGKRLKTCKYSECDEDIGGYILSTVPGLSNNDLENCTNVCERWLISNRLEGCNLSDDDVLCGKHRGKFGLGYNAPNKCMHPSHLEKKKTTVRKMGLLPMTATQIKNLCVEYSSVAKKFILPRGAKWCNRCRLGSSGQEIAAKAGEVCLVCSENHEHLNTEEATAETPRKRKRNCVTRLCYSPSGAQVLRTPGGDVVGTPCSTSTVESQEEFQPCDSSKAKFNSSMHNISDSWTPVRYQVRKPFGMLDKKTQSSLVRKGSKAIDAVLEQIAPGQGTCLN